MRSVTLTVALFAAASVACRHQRAKAPADFNPENLDVARGVREADVIVLGRPTAITELPGQLAASSHPGGDFPLAATQVDLEVLTVIRGPAQMRTVRFIHYDPIGQAQVGPARGPSGPVGYAGIFFLRRDGNHGLRSLVDDFRPDIPAPWIEGAGPVRPSDCGESSGECVSALLLTWRDSDGVGPFVASLTRSAAISHYISGYLPTLQLLRSTLERKQAPLAVQRGLCTQMSGLYPLELPESCVPLLTDAGPWSDYQARAARQRRHFEQGGLKWIEEQLDSRERSQAIAYLRILGTSWEPETRAFAARLLREVRPMKP